MKTSYSPRLNEFWTFPHRELFGLDKFISGSQMFLVKVAHIITLIALVFLFVSHGFAQPPQATPTSQSPPASADQPSDTGTVMRITVNLVQMDAVVTDSKGNPVTNLTRDDFEALQD